MNSYLKAQLNATPKPRRTAMAAVSSMVFVLAMSATLSARADGPGWTLVSTVKRVVVTSNGGVNVRLLPELAGCVSQSGYGAAHASIYPTHPGINRMMASLTAALMAGTTVRLYFTDDKCTVGEMMLGEG